MMRRILACSIALALAGCMVGPDYKRPDFGVPAQYNGAATASGTIQVPGEWWTLYGDPVLDDLVKSGLERNADVKLAAARVEEAEAVVAQARARGLGTVSLPHGDSPHISLMIRDGEFELRESPKFGAARIFDAVVVPNELCARRYRPYLKPEQIRVLGSARYCPEWLDQLAQLLPLPELPRQPGTTRVVMFLRKAPFSLFWSEIEQVIRLLSSMGDIDLIVKWHTRKGRSNPLRRISRPGKEPPRVRFVGDEVHSRQLMAWADIIIDLATSVVYEAVRQNKPVLAAEYLQAGRSALAHYLPETELRCRDDVYLKVRALQRAGRGAFYDPARRERFIADMLDGGGPDVLGRYVDLLESLARPDRAAAPAAAAPLTLAEHA
jgi:hypothetical protein